MSKLYNNIKYACKTNGVKIKDIEHPLKPGAISRYERRGDIMNIPLWIAYKVCKLCGVTIEELIESDMAKSAELDAIREEIRKLRIKEKELIGDVQDGVDG